MVPPTNLGVAHLVGAHTRTMIIKGQYGSPQNTDFLGYSYCFIGSTWKLNLNNRLIPSTTNIGFWDYSRYSTGKIGTANLNNRLTLFMTPSTLFWVAHTPLHQPRREGNCNNKLIRFLTPTHFFDGKNCRHMQHGKGKP